MKIFIIFVGSIAVWVKADGVQKSEMIVLLKVKTVPTFLCHPENMNHCCLNQFKGSYLEIMEENQCTTFFLHKWVVCSP